MRRLLPLLLLLLLVAAAAEARVVQAPETERGGQALPRKAAGSAKGPDCLDAAVFRSGLAFPGGFGWFGVPDLELVARLNAVARAELAAGRPRWRRLHPLGRPAWRAGPKPLLPRLR
ncbi:hypothetical protein ACFQY5_16585 [Paeniroseomonas aquatica]|uniref:Uncharacterized protein n=1 Tax=Paeniroseomonas aquatica TaxID=373043 RepID=A0ABT8AFC4_9PROT|nr:hypothetical protein [Paeniroseomonas aquatica]MDN3568523.1 hypothetical protein [Paeniroseomonas aquatica]